MARRTDDEGITKENQVWFHKQLFIWRERALRAEEKLEACKKTMAVVIDAYIQKIDKDEITK